MTLDDLKKRFQPQLAGGSVTLDDQALPGLGTLLGRELKLGRNSLTLRQCRIQTIKADSFTLAGQTDFLGFQNLAVTALFCTGKAASLPALDIVAVLATSAFATWSDFVAAPAKFAALGDAGAPLALSQVQLLLANAANARPPGFEAAPGGLPLGLSVAAQLDLAATYREAGNAATLPAFGLLKVMPPPSLAIRGPVSWIDPAKPAMTLTSQVAAMNAIGTLPLPAQVAIGVAFSYQPDLRPQARLFLAGQTTVKGRQLELRLGLPLPPSDPASRKTFAPLALPLVLGPARPGDDLFDLGDLADLLGKVPGIGDLLGKVPGLPRDFGLRSIGLVVPLPLATPLSAQADFGLARGKTWTPIAGLAIGDLGLQVLVTDPLDRGRRWMAALAGRVTFRGLDFTLSLNLPGLRLAGTLGEDVGIDFRAFGQLLAGAHQDLPALVQDKKNADLTFSNVAFVLDLATAARTLEFQVELATVTWSLFGLDFALQSVLLRASQAGGSTTFAFDGVVVLANELWWLSGSYQKAAGNSGFVFKGGLSAPLPLPLMQLVGRLADGGGDLPGWMASDVELESLTLALDTRKASQSFAIQGAVGFGGSGQPPIFDLGFVQLEDFRLSFALGTRPPERLPDEQPTASGASGTKVATRAGKYRGYLLLDSDLQVGGQPCALELGFVFDETRLLIGRLSSGAPIDPLAVAGGWGLGVDGQTQTMAAPAQQAMTGRQKANAGRYQLDVFVDLGQREFLATLAWGQKDFAYLFAVGAKTGAKAGFQFGIVDDGSVLRAILKLANLDLADAGNLQLDQIAVVVSTLGSEPWNAGEATPAPAPTALRKLLGAENIELRRGVNFLAALRFPAGGGDIYDKTSQKVVPLANGKLLAAGFLGQVEGRWAAGFFVDLQVRQLLLPFGDGKLADTLDADLRLGLRLQEGGTPRFSLLLELAFTLGKSRWLSAERDKEWSDDLQVVGRLEIDSLGVQASASLIGTWRDAFGIKGLELSDLAFVLGFAWEDELPTVGFTGLLDIGQLQGFLAVLFNSKSPQQSLFAGCVSDVSLGHVASALLGNGAVSPELSGIFDSLFTVQGVALQPEIAAAAGDARLLDAGRLPPSLVQGMAACGHVLPAARGGGRPQVSVHVASAGAKWFLFDHQNINGYTVALEAGKFRCEWQAEIYVAPQATTVGAFTFPAGLRLDGRLRLLGIFDLFALVRVSKDPAGLAAFLDFPEALVLFHALTLTRPAGILENVLPPVDASAYGKYRLFDGKSGSLTGMTLLAQSLLPIALDPSKKGPLFSFATYANAFQGSNVPAELKPPHLLIAAELELFDRTWAKVYLAITTSGFDFALELELFGVADAGFRCHAGHDGFRAACDLRVGLDLDLGSPSVGGTALWTPNELSDKAKGPIEADLGIALAYDDGSKTITAALHAELELFGQTRGFDIDLRTDGRFFGELEDAIRTGLEAAIADNFGKGAAAVASWLQGVAGDYFKYGGAQRQGEILLSYVKEGELAAADVGALWKFLGYQFKDLKDLFTGRFSDLAKDVEAQFGFHVDGIDLLQRGGPDHAPSIADTFAWFDAHVGKKLADAGCDLRSLYRPDRQWLSLIASHVLAVIDLQAMLFDPADYGLKVKLAVGAFDFELDVLYHRVNDDLGVFSIDYRQENQHFAVGPFTFLVPAVRLDLYTDGNFRIDVGYPRGDDWSRSLHLSMLSSVGAAPKGDGGFYLAKLGRGLAGDLQGNVVLAVGLALRFGFEDSMSVGVLSGGYKIGFAGSLEGAVGLGGSGGGLEDLEPHSFRFAGHLTVTGSVWGKLDFGLVQASISVAIAASIALAIDSVQREVAVRFRCHLEARAELTVHCGLFKIHLHFSFSRDLTFGVNLQIPQHVQARHAFRSTRPEGGALPATRAATRSVPAPDELGAAVKRLKEAELPLLGGTDETIEVRFYPEWSALFDAGGHGSLQLIGSFGIGDAALDRLARFLMHAVLEMRQPGYALPKGATATEWPAVSLDALNELRDALDRDLWFWLGADPGRTALDLGKRLRQAVFTQVWWSYTAAQADEEHLHFFPPDPNLALQWGNFDGDRHVEGDAADFSKTGWMSWDDYRKLVSYYADQLGETPAPVEPWGDDLAPSLSRPTYATMVYSSYCELLLRSAIRLVIREAAKGKDLCRAPWVDALDFSELGPQLSLHFRHGWRPGGSPFSQKLGTQVDYGSLQRTAQAQQYPPYHFRVAKSPSTASSNVGWSAPWDYRIRVQPSYYALDGAEGLAAWYARLASYLGQGLLHAPRTGLEGLSLQPAAMARPRRYALPLLAAVYAGAGAVPSARVFDAAALGRSGRAGSLRVRWQRWHDGGGGELAIGLAAPVDADILDLSAGTRGAWGCRFTLRLRRCGSGGENFCWLVGLPAAELPALAALRQVIADGDSFELRLLRPPSAAELKADAAQQGGRRLLTDAFLLRLGPAAPVDRGQSLAVAARADQDAADFLAIVHTASLQATPSTLLTLGQGLALGNEVFASQGGGELELLAIWQAGTKHFQPFVANQAQEVPAWASCLWLDDPPPGTSDQGGLFAEDSVELQWHSVAVPHERVLGFQRPAPVEPPLPQSRPGIVARRLTASAGRLFAIQAIDDSIWRWDESARLWRRIGEGARELVADGDRLYKIESWGQALRGAALSGTVDGSADVAWSERYATGLPVLHIAAQGSRDVLWTDASQSGYRNQVVGSGATAVAAGGENLVLLCQGAIYRNDGARPATPVLLYADRDHPAIALAAQDDDVYAIVDPGELYRYSGQGQVWNHVGSRVSGLAAGKDGHFYSVGSNGQVWACRNTGRDQTSAECIQIGDDTVSLTLDGSTLYRLDRAGRAWRYGGQGQTWTNLGESAPLPDADDRALGQYHLDNAYSNVVLTTTQPDDGGRGPIELRPIAPQRSSAQDSQWHYLAHVPVAPAPSDDADPYRGVGKSCAVEGHVRDFYGNILEPSRRHLDLPLLYRDPLIPVAAWPAVSASYAIGSQGVWSVHVTLAPSQRAKDKLTPAAREAAAARLQLARWQLAGNDPQRLALSLSLDSPSWGNGTGTFLADPSRVAIEPSGKLADFAQAMALWLVDQTFEPDPWTLGWRHLDQPVPPAAPSPFRVWVCSARSQHVDDEAALQIPAVRSVASELPAMPAHDETNSAFEKSFPGLTLAKAKSADAGAAPWAVPLAWLTMASTKAEPVFFAAEPISNVLESGIAYLPADLGATPAPSRWQDAGSHRFTDLDCALLAQELFETIDTVLAPAVVAAAATLDADATRSLLEGRDSLAAGFARQLGPLFENSPAGDPEAARDFFEDLLCRGLNAAYDVDVIVQLELRWTAFSLPAGSTCRVQGTVTSTAAASTFRPAAAVATPDGQGRGFLTFACQAPSDARTQARHGDQLVASEPLQFTAEMLVVRAPAAKDPIFLQLVRPIVVPLEPSPCPLPIVRRLYPLPPTLVAQRWSPSVLRPDASTPFEDLLAWTYTFELEVDDTAQDEVRLRFDLGGAVSSRENGVDLDDRSDHVPLTVALARAHFGLQALREAGRLPALIGLAKTPLPAAATAERARAALCTLATLVGWVVGNTSWTHGRPAPMAELHDAYALRTVADAAVAGGLSTTLSPLDRDHSCDQAALVSVTPLADGERFPTSRLVRLPGKAPSVCVQQVRYQPKQDPRWRRREVARSQLQILRNDRLASRVHLVRNVDLLPGRTTRGVYVFSTPPIGFARPLTPGLDVHQLVYGIDRVGLADTSPASFEAWMERLLARFFALADQEPLTLRVEVRYGYPLGSTSAAAAVALPVALSVVPQAPLAPGQAPDLAKDLAGAYADFARKNPGLQEDGYLEVGIVIFGEEGAGTLLFRAPFIRLPLALVQP